MVTHFLTGVRLLILRSGRRMTGNASGPAKMETDAWRYDIRCNIRSVLETDVLVAGLRGHSRETMSSGFWTGSWIKRSRFPHYHHRGMIRDPNDEKFVTAAVNGMAEALVTFNIRDYVPLDARSTGFGINICRPGEILRSIPWRPSATSRFGSLLH
jgi:hypothetical protein